MKPIVSYFALTVWCALLTASAHSQLRTVWHRPLPGGGTILSDAAIDAGGNITLVGTINGSTQVIVCHVASSGAIRWIRNFDLSPRGEELNSVVVSSVGTFVAGGKLNFGSGVYRSIALALTQDGNVVGQYTEPGHISTGGVARLADGNVAFFGGVGNPFGRSVNTTALNGLCVPIWSRSYSPNVSYLDLVGRGRAHAGRVVRTGEVTTSAGRGFPFLLSYRQNGDLLHSNLFNHGQNRGTTHSSMLAVNDEGYSALGSSVEDALIGVFNALYYVGPFGERHWDRFFEPTDPFSASSFPVWFDPLDRLMAVWNDQSGFSVLLHIDKETGQVVRGQPLPLPMELEIEYYYAYASDERGAVYCFGVSFDNNYRTIRQLLLKVDRNFRIVWFERLPPPYLSGWTTYHRGHVYVMSGASQSPPPLSKYKILPVFSEGDVNGDECIDDADLAKLLQGYGTTDPSLDLNADGIVDATDLEELLHNFGLGCEG